jgi:hypothetical protein
LYVLLKAVHRRFFIGDYTGSGAVGSLEFANWYAGERHREAGVIHDK